MPQNFNQSIIDEFRANHGKVGGPFEGAELVLLTTTGAKSGNEHTAPLGVVRHGDEILVIASAGGADRHPDWYHNVLANPMAQVETGAETYGAVAVPAAGEERVALFAHAVRQAPGYADYQAATSRPIPVVKLQRTAVPETTEVSNFSDKLVEIHSWLRLQLGTVRTEADAYFAVRAAHQGPGAPPAPGLGLQLKQHCLAFCQSLHVHHTNEDAGMFPGLEDAHPELAGTLARLRSEHVTVTRIQGELLELLSDIGTADPDRFRIELDRMTTELTAHLDYEEEVLAPVLSAIPFPPGTFPESGQDAAPESGQEAPPESGRK